MNPHIMKLIEEYGELKKREGVLEADIRHHISMLSTLKEEIHADKPKIKIEVDKTIPRNVGITDFLREWVKANNLDIKITKPKQLLDITRRQFPNVSRGQVASALQSIRGESK